MLRLIFITLISICFQSAIAAQQPPPTQAIVTTLVSDYPGAVGGLITDNVGYVFIADFKNSIWQFNPANLEMKQFADGFYGSSGITLDRNGNIYQSSYFGHSISKVSRSGEVSTVVTEGLNGPVGLLFNQANELLVCNCNDQSIKKVDAAGVVSDFARSEDFNCPNGITMDAQGNTYVVSFSGAKIVKLTPEGEASVFADSQGNGLGHITIVNGVFYATSFNDNKVYRIAPDGTISLFAGTGERGQKNGLASEATFSSPNGISADFGGNYLYINDYTGDASASGMERTPFSIRRIELPNLGKILDYTLENQSIEDMKTAYHDYISDPGNVGENTFTTMNLLGWKYLGNEQANEAVALFELNVESNPESWNAYSSLGAGYMQINENEKAIEVLQKSLELNPANLVAKGRLVTLGAMEAES